MNANRSAAVSAGLLFIIATVTNILGTTLSRSALAVPEDLTQVSASATQLTRGALLELVSAFACAGIAISLYPVLKDWDGGLALGSVVFRTMEAIMYAIGALALLCLLALSRQAILTETTERAPFLPIGDVLRAVRDQAALVGVAAFCVGGFMYYLVLYRSRLIPRWLSGWGILAIISLIVAWTLALANGTSMLSYAMLAVPIGLQEMVLAFWLILKGFSQSGLASLQRQAPTLRQARAAPPPSGGP